MSYIRTQLTKFNYLHLFTIFLAYYLHLFIVRTHNNRIKALYHIFPPKFEQKITFFRNFLRDFSHFSKNNFLSRCWITMSFFQHKIQNFWHFYNKTIPHICTTYTKIIDKIFTTLSFTNYLLQTISYTLSFT